MNDIEKFNNAIDKAGTEIRKDFDKTNSQITELFVLIAYFQQFYEDSKVNLDLWNCGNSKMINILKVDLDNLRSALINNHYGYIDKEVALDKKKDESLDRLRAFYLKKWKYAQIEGYLNESKFIKDEITDLEHRFSKEINIFPVLRRWIEFLKEKKVKDKAVKDFVSILQHNNIDILMKMLHKHLDNNNSGREIAKVLKALESKNILLSQSYKTSQVIKEFNLQCSKQAINKYRGNGMLPIDEIQQVINILP